MKKTFFVFFLLTSISLISFDFYKASHASYTCDESFTYLNYVHMSVIQIISYHNPFPNNHILNSLLMKFSEALFGSSELALRLPNIVAHVLFLLYTYKLLKRYCPQNGIFFFILVNANPFMIDFFSLARGYGLAIGLMSAGLYFYCRYIENAGNRHQVLAWIFICLSSLANFGLINLLLALIMTHNILNFLFYNKPFSFRSIWNVNQKLIFVLCIYLIIVYEPLRKIFKWHLIDFGGMDGFWNDTVLSLANTFSYDAGYKTIMRIACEIFVIAFSTLFIVRAINYFKKRKSLKLNQRISVLFGLLIFFIVSESIVQNLLLRTPFLVDRFAVFIYPIFILMISFLCADLWNNPFKYFLRTTIYVSCTIFFLHTCFALNTSWYFMWFYDSNTKEMLSNLKRESENRTPVSLGVNWIFEPTINFYRKTLSLDWLNEVNRNGLKPENDYYYIFQEEFRKLPQDEVLEIKCYSPTGNYLVKNLRR